MNPSSILIWEDRVTRLSLALLLLANAYGIVVGATITMYYDLTPNMGTLEDNLGSIQLILYLFAFIVSLFHLPLAVSDVKHKLWKQASIRAAVLIGPLIIFLGTEGLISHFLWWSPISETDRFHMLHHAVVGGAPLTLGYWLVLHWWWRPATLSAPSISRRASLVSGLVFVMVIMVLSIPLAGISPITVGVIAIIGFLALLVLWRLPS